MKLLLITPMLLIALASVSSPGFAQDAGQSPAPAQPVPTSAAMADKPAATSNATTGDSLALGLLAAINEQEIAAAKQAKSKNVSGPVLDYAQTMQKEHGENLAKTTTLGPLSNDSAVQAQKAKGAGELMTLGLSSGKAYANAYMEAMVKGHAEALDMIDNKMLPAATSASVKQHLTETRAHVANHLVAAKEITATL
jgi:putative membrane protein